MNRELTLDKGNMLLQRNLISDKINFDNPFVCMNYAAFSYCLKRTLH